MTFRPRTWIVLGALVLVAFVGTVVTLNLTVYSANGFARSYLDALARHDLRDALATPGVELPDAGSRALLRPDAMGPLTDIHLVSDRAAGDRHTLTYAFSSGAKEGRTTFTVERDGTELGLFAGWRFATSPAATLAVTPQHAATFTANGLPVSPKAGADVATKYTVLAPGGFVLSHRSTWLEASPLTTLVDRPGGTESADVQVRANAAFVREVQKELNAYLADCAKQKVLQPTGCPMGQQIDDRIQDAPTWSMVKNPRISIVPGPKAGEWQTSGSNGTAHLTVTVKSIFDGSISTFSKNVPFAVDYVVTFQPDGTLLIAGQ
ncbi:MAG: hypothetical protein JWN36_747 [Microbacteriaceae bacterium]|nr:hypothetical protein [Microbacteriaceae bacterium]